MSSSNNHGTTDSHGPVDNPVFAEQNALDSSGEESVNQEDVNGGTPNMNPTSATPALDPFAAITQAFTPKRAVTYLRVSTREQAQRGGRDEGFSIPAQREANKKKVQSLGALIVKEFVDPGESGTSINRPGLKEMIAYLREEGDNIDYLVVHKIDRLARNRADDVKINEILNELNIRLISTSENIDETPSGLLVHGIMASIAEFYSANLSNEVKKGMREKVRNGGMVGRAPLGYVNIRTIVNGREDRTVELDEKRAPLVREAFELYATGEWTLQNLAEALATRGLTTHSTIRVPEKPITAQKLHALLTNEFYLGRVNYQGTTFPGNHEPLISLETFDSVQAILHSRVNGERTRRHPHFLRSSIYCGICGSRLIVTKVRSQTGEHYEYFLCAGRHSKREPDCEFKALPINQLEDQIQALYDRIALSPAIRDQLELPLHQQLQAMKANTAQETTELTEAKNKIERQRQKLLEAHYQDAIPLDVLRTEQDRLTRELANTDRRLAELRQDISEHEHILHEAFTLAQWCAKAYEQAPDHIKRMFNQIFFTKIYVLPEEHTGNPICEGTFAHPMDIIFNRTITSSQIPKTGKYDQVETPHSDATQKRDEPTENPGKLASPTTNRDQISLAPVLNTTTLVGLTRFELATP